MTDDEARAQLTAVRGIGPWTADMFLLGQLGRPDILPAGDLGIRHAVQAAYGMDHVPSEGEVRVLGEGWRPNRSLATAYLYGSLRGPAPGRAARPSPRLGRRGAPDHDPHRLPAPAVHGPAAHPDAARGRRAGRLTIPLLDGLHRYHRDLPESRVWTFDGTVPGPRSKSSAACPWRSGGRTA